GIRDWSVTGVQTCALPIYDGRVLDEYALDFERSDAVGARGDDVVVAALEPEVAVFVHRCLVTGEVEGAAERLGRSLRVVVVAGEQPDGTLRFAAYDDVPHLAGLDRLAVFV